jgi:hypothetical protein
MPNDPVTVTRQMFDRLYRDFTYGLFDGLPDGAYVHSGGSLHDVITHQFVSTYRVYDATALPIDVCGIVKEYCDDQRDIDLFLHGTKSQNIQSIVQIIHHLRRSHTLELVDRSSSVIDIKINTLPRTIQLIVATQRNPAEICDGFDMTHLMAYYDWHDIQVNNAWCSAHQTQITRLTYDTTKQRTYKALSRNYAIDITQPYNNALMMGSITHILSSDYAELQRYSQKIEAQKICIPPHRVVDLIYGEQYDESDESEMSARGIVVSYPCATKPCSKYRVLHTQNIEHMINTMYREGSDRYFGHMDFAIPCADKLIRARVSRHGDYDERAMRCDCVDCRDSARKVVIVLHDCRVLHSTRRPVASDHTQSCYIVDIDALPQMGFQHADRFCNALHGGEYIKHYADHETLARFATDMSRASALKLNSFSPLRENETYDWIAIRPRVTVDVERQTIGMYWIVDSHHRRPDDVPPYRFGQANNYEASMGDACESDFS